MKKIFLFFIVWTAASNLTFAQSVSTDLISSSGESFSEAGYQLDWSVGECVTATFSNTDYMLMQGFHQGTWIITAVRDFKKEMLVSVFPNPTSDFINLKFENPYSDKMQYVITDISGTVIGKNNINTSVQSINVSNLTAGTYFLTISENSKLIKSYKIIKN
jgi:hypothetical protein